MQARWSFVRMFPHALSTTRSCACAVHTPSLRVPLLHADMADAEAKAAASWAGDVLDTRPDTDSLSQGDCPVPHALQWHTQR